MVNTEAFQPFFPVSSTSGGRNLFFPGRFKPGFNPVSSTRWKKPANPGSKYMGTVLTHVMLELEYSGKTIIVADALAPWVTMSSVLQWY